MLDSVLNPLDLHALTLARRIVGDDPRARVVYLSMGPPQARETLRECLSRVPGQAILLTDRSFAGADTVATAYSLACAIRRIEHELFAGSRDYVILAGMQSVDGDTAQVPPQIAEDLGIDQIAYATDLTPGPPLVVRRIGPAGPEEVTARRHPVLITVTACTEPVYRSFRLAREALEGPISEWSAVSVGARAERIGLRGSRTQVYRLFSPTEERARSCVLVHDAAQLVALIEERYHAAPGPSAELAEAPYVLGDREPSYHGPFWVYAERGPQGVRSVSLELLGAARELAGCLGEQVAALLPCDAPGGDADELISHGADTVYLVEHPLLRTFLPAPYTLAVAPLIRERRPQAVLFGATPLGRELAPRVAYTCDCGLTADCTRLEIGDYVKGGQTRVGILRQTRPALGGNVMATIMTKDCPTQMATVRPGVLPLPVRDPTHAGEVIHVLPDLSGAEIGVEVRPLTASSVTAPLGDAAVIVAGGRGLHSRTRFEALVSPLAAAFARRLGAHGEVAASRMAVEDGFASRDRQVGQTGQTVRPKLYVALGISGAVQHISGMQHAATIVAINKDPRARIFSYADVGLIGDLETVVPELMRSLGDATHAAH